MGDKISVNLKAFTAEQWADLKKCAKFKNLSDRTTAIAFVMVPWIEEVKKEIETK